jgi:hypothetical protein
VTVPDRRKVTDAVLSLVAAGTSPRPVGDHKAPEPLDYPYSVLYAIDGGGFWGPALSAPDRAADFVYQVDAVAKRRDQCEWMADTIRRTFLARQSSGAFQVSLTYPVGWVVADRQPDGGAGTVVRDGPVAEGGDTYWVYSQAQRFVVRVVPA